VAVIGAGASAFDAAATALEAGARTVDLFARRDHVAAVPVTRTRAYAGAQDNYPHLPDALRWRLARRFREAGSTPPPDAVARAMEHAGFGLHLGAPWTEASLRQGEVVAVAGGEARVFDFVIAGTGYSPDPSLRPELAEIAPHVLRWRDRRHLAAEEGDPGADAGLGAHPYLGLGFEYLERRPGAAPFLRDIHVFNPQGFVSFGLPIGDVPSLKRGVAAVTARIGQDLFFADIAHHEARILGDIAPEFGPDLYADAVRSRPSVAAE
jgi:cation diffusion facilitator CzcD-associated flavoprotein CzcO